MARSRLFVPQFDRLNLRVVPSHATAAAVAAEAQVSVLPPDDDDLPGSDPTLDQLITWELPVEQVAQTIDRRSPSYLADEDPIVPTPGG